MKNFLLSCFLTITGIFGLNAQNVVNVTGNITTNTTWTSNQIYDLSSGFHYVTNNATLTIEPGTLIKSVGGSIVITRGSKIMADGTATRPIVMTSGNPAGQRNPMDWGGLLILGNAPINDPAGQRLAEGGIDPTLGLYGGNNPTDNSGIVRYVRIEFAGIPYQPNNETNGLTMGGVGSGTIIENVQVSFGGDDAFEWFGGTVNGKKLVAFRNVDDDFDADYGFSGNVQFGLVVRDPQIADISGSNGFEVDNDATGTTNSPFTDANFSNFTVIGPQQTLNATVNSNYRRGAHVRRSNKIDIFNSVFSGYPTGLLVDGVNTCNYMLNGELKFKNNILAGMGTPFAVAAAPANFTATTVQSIFLMSGGTTLTNPADLQYTSPYNFTSPDFNPQAGSPVLNGADFSDAELQNGFFQSTSYRGAFGSNGDWTKCWCEFDPQNANYTSPINYLTGNVSISQSAVACAGVNTTLTATAGYSSYLWSNGGTSQTTTVTQAGTYTVTVTNTRGCTATAQIVVTVLPAPVVTITGTTAICPGRTTVLTATGGGTYLWNTGLTRNALTTAALNANTTYTVTVTGANGCQTTASVTVTVNPVTPTISGISPICAGTTQTLTATGGTSYRWSPAATGNAITVAPTATTTYKVTVTNATGCTATTSFIVTVLAKPTVTITPATANVCLGNSLTLTATANLASYLWSNGATTNTITVTPQQTTTYTVTVTNASGCSNTASKLVTVWAYPQTPVITANGPTTFCQTGTTILNPTTLSTQAVQGMTIAWLKNGVVQAGQVNTTYTPTLAGTYTVRYTNAGGCATTSAPVTLVINAQPAAAFTGVCTGTQVNLTATPASPAATPNLYSYQWYLNGQPINGATARTFSAITSGTYAVSVTNTTTNCGKLSVTRDINSFTAPTVATIVAQGPTAIPTGGSLTMNVVTPNPAFTYQWFRTNTAIAGAVNTTYSVNTAGTYRVKTVNGPCSSAYSNSIIVTIAPGQTNMVQQDVNVLEAAPKMNLFPNPSSNDEVYVEFTTENDNQIEISIVDMTGRVVFSKLESLQAGDQFLQLNINELSEGMYFVNIKDGEASRVAKLVVTK